MVCMLVRILMALSLAVAASAATVTGTFKLADGTAYTSTVTFRPVSSPSMVGADVVTGADIKLTPTSGGYVSTSLSAGYYSVYLGSTRRFTIAVPSGSDTVDVTSILTTPAWFVPGEAGASGIITNTYAKATTNTVGGVLIDSTSTNPVVYLKSSVDTLVGANVTSLSNSIGVVSANLVTVSNAFRGSQAVVPPSLATNWFTISTWGDSLTAGSGASPSSNAYPSVLSLLSGFTVLNGGVGGETSTQVKTRMLAATNQHANPTIIWVGRNNYSSPSTVVADVAEMVAALQAAGNTNRYLILSVLNGSYGSYEAPGGEGWSYITNINGQLAGAYGTRYVDVRSHLVSLYNPSDGTDTADYAAKRPPTSLRSDAIHLNNAGYGVVGMYIYTNRFAELRGDWSPQVSARGLQMAFAAPSPIGITTPSTGSFSDLYSIFLRVGGTSNFKTFSLSGDYSSVQLNGHMIPLAHNQSDLGYSSALAWNDGYFGGTVYSTNLSAYSSITSPFASLSEVVTPLLRIGSVGTNKFLSLSGDSSSLQVNGNLIPLTDGLYDIGFATSQQRFRNLFLSGDMYAVNGYLTSAVITNLSSTGTLTITNSGNSARINSDTDYRGYKFNNNGGSGFGSGATCDLLTFGSYAKIMSGLLTVRTWSASSRGLYTYVVGVIGGGDAATISPLSFQQYGPSALTGTLTLVKDTPSGGTDTIRFTVGANAVTAIEFVWKPFYVEGSSTVTGF